MSIFQLGTGYNNAFSSRLESHVEKLVIIFPEIMDICNISPRFYQHSSQKPYRHIEKTMADSTVTF